MQDQSTFQLQPMNLQFPENEQLKCPRCDSNNTKFCYYNNYNLSQPRHFCKNCKRYWTKGGALRNIPVGGATRKNNNNKNKRSSNNQHPKRPNPAADPDLTQTENPSQAAAGVGQDSPQARIYRSPLDQERKILDVSGSFSSLLASSGQFGGLLEGLNRNGSDLNSGPDPRLQVNGDGDGPGGNDSEEGDSSGWIGNSNRWPDLAIYTPGPGSSFQQRNI